MLRDAFNRDVFPQGGPNNNAMKGGACAPITPGPPAYESATPFGNIGTNTFGNVSALNNETMFDQGPSYKLPGVHMGAGSGYGAMGFISNYSGAQDNRYGRQPGRYGGPTNQPTGYGGDQTSGYGDQTGGYGGHGGHGGYGGHGGHGGYGGGNGGGGCAPCQAGNGGVGGGGNGSMASQMVNELVYDENAQGGGEDENLDASHSSVNRELVKFLRKSIIKLSRQLKIKPDWVDLSPDGGASWKYSSMVAGNSIWCRVFTKVEIHGERKGCKRPIPHICNITTTTKIKLDPELVVELLKEFPMMSYCSSTNNLQLTMDSLEHNLAMLALICACQQDKIPLNHIKYYDLPKKYMLLTTPGSKRYHPAAKYSLIRQIRS
jgi:hypothetical protein